MIKLFKSKIMKITKLCLLLASGAAITAIDSCQPPEPMYGPEPEYGVPTYQAGQDVQK